MARLIILELEDFLWRELERQAQERAKHETPEQALKRVALTNLLDGTLSRHESQRKKIEVVEGRTTV